MPETMINNTIVDILYKLVNEQALLPGEQAILENWLSGSEHKQQLLNELKNEEWLFEELKKRYAFDTAGEWDKMLKKLRADTVSHQRPVTHRVHFLKTSWFRYAAAVVVLLGGVGSWFWLSHTGTHEAVVMNPRPAAGDIQPGTNRAILTVGNKTIDLATNKTGIAVGNAITYTDGEKIAEAGQMVEVTTPRGGQYYAVLSDGSKVWLNAASSIKFPSSFKGDSREIEITGEIYLEVAQNVKQSFVIKTGDTEVQVLGTSFNINAYTDEDAVRTTLVEGSVKVKAVGKELVLKPGQQASVTYKDHSLVKSTVQTDEVLAWRSGIFNFNNADIKAMMRQISRWYDVDVVYEGQIPERIFEGKMQRDIPLSSALKILELNKINFRVEGKRIIVMP